MFKRPECNPQFFLELFQLISLLDIGQSYDRALCPSTSRTTSAMLIGLRRFWQIEIEYVIYIRDIKTTGSQIGRQQQLYLPLT